MPALRLAALALVAALLAVAPARPAAAQPEPVKYWIFLTDKQPDAARGGALPRVAVTERARERRRMRGSAARPALADVPVADAYLDRLRAAGIEPVVASRWFNAVSAVLSAEQVAAVRALPFVRGLRPVGRLATERTPPEPASPVRLLDYGASRLQLDLINARAPIEAGYTGAGVVVGFLDTTYDFEHPALAPILAGGRLLGQMNFTGQSQTNTHGLSVASVAVGFDEGDLIGPGYAASVLAATTEYAPTETHQEEDYFVAGMEWMEQQGADVVNVSLGYSTFDPGEFDYTYEDMDGNTTLVTRASDIAAALGIAVVASAGNEGNSSWTYITAPADADSVIVAGAMHADSSRAGFSSIGPTFDGRTKPDVMALGVGVIIARADGTYGNGNGTSFSAPLVSGVVAQILQSNPDLDPIAVRNLLRETAGQADAPDNERGWGVVNAEAAIAQALLLSNEGANPAGPVTASVYPTLLARSRRTLTVEVHGLAHPVRTTLRLYDVLGREVGLLYDGPPRLGPFSVALPPLAAGVYFYRFSAGDSEAGGRIVVQ